MKRSIIFFSMFMMAFTVMQAQPSANSTNAKVNFLGTWDVVLIGVPDGDVNCQLILDEKDGKLSGFLKFDETEAGKIAIINPEIKDSVLTFNAPLRSYDVDFNLTQTKEGHLDGTLFNGMFTATGKRSEGVGQTKEK